MITTAEILRIALLKGACDIRVSLPGRVVRVKSTGRVDVQIQSRVARPVPDEKLEFYELPELMDVPVVWPSTQAAAIVMRLQVGDPGWLSFADHALGAWLTAGDVVSPAVHEVHGLSGALFTPGLWPGDEGPEHLTNVDARFEVRDGVRLDMIGDVAQFTAGGAAAKLALKSDVDALQTRVTSLENKFLGHSHATAATGAPSPPQPITPGGLIAPTTPATIVGTIALESE